MEGTQRSVRIFTEDGVYDVDSNYVVLFVDSEDRCVHCMANVVGDGNIVDKLATSMTIQAGELFQQLTIRRDNNGLDE